MYNVVLLCCEEAKANTNSSVNRWTPGEFAMATIHRAENTVDPTRTARYFAMR
jgi:hypothetical protein